MCIDIEELRYIRRPLTVYKVVRRAENGTFKSWSHTYNRNAQLYGKLGSRSSRNLGSVKLYPLGKTVIDLEGHGFYCFLRTPPQLFNRWNYATLKCEVPSGVWIYTGTYGQEEVILTPILEICQELYLSKD